MPTRLKPRHNFCQPTLRLVTDRIAKKPHGINLSQGTCQLPVPEVAIRAKQRALDEGYNRYCPADGVPVLREAIFDKLERFNGIQCGPEDIMVTHGSTGAFETVCDTYLSEGDEVIVFTPAYPYHIDKLIDRGVVTNRIPLSGPDWHFNPDKLAKSFTARTRFVLLCNPANPTGKVFSREELSLIADLCTRNDVACVTDEVYEFITFDTHIHLSIASFPGMYERTITMGSFSKTYAITGWRIGYICAPQQFYPALRSTWDHKGVCANVPAQFGVAAALTTLPEEYYGMMRRQYTKKREILCSGLRDAGFSPRWPQGAYYAIASTTSRFPQLTSEQVVDRLVDEIEVGAVPASDFLGREVLGNPRASNIVRFNFAMPDETLEEAARRIRHF